MADQAAIQDEFSDGVLRAADGTPLRKKLRQSLRRRRSQALMLTLPLILFMVVTFVLPIGQMLLRSTHNAAFPNALPKVTAALANWDGQDLPPESTFKAMVEDLTLARKEKTIGRAATRVNYDFPGTRSLFTSSSRKAKKITEPPYKDALIKLSKKWADPEVWSTMKRVSAEYSAGFYLASLDMKENSAGDYVQKAEERRIYVPLFIRTLWMSALITLICAILAYPIAYLLSVLPLRYSNLLMILVLLPFWTSLLVRTTAWIAILQSQGVLNDILVAIGVVSDDGRLQLIYNRTGTIVAMVHILLPFMVLPLYSVMKTIPPSLVRAARSMGATETTAHMRIYFPLTLPGIAAGTLLVFILAIGYYITPALVGGQSGQLISNMIAFHMKQSLNWSLAAALGAILLAGVLILYWLYNRLIGVDNMKFG